MNIVRRNNSPLSAFRPRAMEDQFGRLVESMFEDMFGAFGNGAGLSQLGADSVATPRLNVSETAQAFEVEAELPGVRKEDVKVSVENQRVTIEAETQRENERREGENVVYSERSASKFLRSFSLPADVDEGAAEAKLDNGVLHLTLPKKQGSAATRLTIQ